MGNRKRYSDRERADALAILDACGGNYSEASRKTGIPLTTLASWVDRGVHEEVTEMRKENRKEMAERIEGLVHDILDIIPSKMEQASAKELTVMLGISVDKLMLLRGEATSNTKQVIRIVTDEGANEDYG